MRAAASSTTTRWRPVWGWPGETGKGLLAAELQVCLRVPGLGQAALQPHRLRQTRLTRYLAVQAMGAVSSGGPVRLPFWPGSLRPRAPSW